MDVKGDWACGRKYLHEKGYVRTKAFCEARAQHFFRKSLDQALERDRADAFYFNGAESLFGAVGPAVSSDGAEPDPVLGPPVVRPAGNAAKSADKRSSLIEAVEGVVWKRQWPLDGIRLQLSFR